MNRATVIRAHGNPEIAGAIADGMREAEMKLMRTQYARLEAVNGVRCEADDRRWEKTKKRLAKKYRVEKPGRAYEIVVGAWAMLWYGIYSMFDYLRKWNREG